MFSSQMPKGVEHPGIAFSISQVSCVFITDAERHGAGAVPDTAALRTFGPVSVTSRQRPSRAQSRAQDEPRPIHRINVHTHFQSSVNSIWIEIPPTCYSN